MQKHWRLTTCVALLISSVATVAFTQSSTPQVTITAPTSSGGYAATFTGCVERIDELATAGPASQNTDGVSFLLTHAIRGQADRPQPVPVATSGVVGDTARETTYKLDAAASTLGPHVGHEVEVTGFVTVLMGGTASPTPAGGAFAALDGNPRVKVEKIRTIAGTCGRQST